jgi:4-hydroxy-2-oxoheptanedioate aldolase
MDLPVNAFKQRLGSGARQVGFWLTLGSAYAAEAVAGAGFDWLLVDMEHSPAGPECVLAQLQAIAPYRTAPVVRPPHNDAVIIKRLLDLGAQSLLIPYVQSGAEAAAAVAAVRYPPGGIRGVSATTRASRFGRVPGYGKIADRELCLILQIETEEALGELETIAGTDGVDAVFFGPGDLAASLGHIGEPGHPSVTSRILEAIHRAAAIGRPSGLLTADLGFATECMDAGASFVAVGVDASVLARGADQLVAHFSP